jgi:hypothetical protein
LANLLLEWFSFLAFHLVVRRKRTKPIIALMFFAFKKWMKPSADFAVGVRGLFVGSGEAAAGKNALPSNTTNPSFQSKHFALY